MLLLSSISSSKASVVIDASNVYSEQSITQVSYEERRFTVHNRDQETFEVPASCVRGINGLSEKAILHVLENGLAYIRVKHSGGSYGIDVNFRLRGGEPITPENKDNYSISSKGGSGDKDRDSKTDRPSETKRSDDNAALRQRIADLEKRTKVLEAEKCKAASAKSRKENLALAGGAMGFRGGWVGSTIGGWLGLRLGELFCESDDSPGTASSGVYGRQRSGPAGRQRSDPAGRQITAPSGRHSLQTATTDYSNIIGTRDYVSPIVRDGYLFGGAKSESMLDKAARLDTRSERELLDAAAKRAAAGGFGSTVVRYANPVNNSNSGRDNGMSFSYDRDIGGFSIPCGDRSADAAWGKS